LGIQGGANIEILREDRVLLLNAESIHAEEQLAVFRPLIKTWTICKINLWGDFFERNRNIFAACDHFSIKSSGSG